MLVQNSVKFNGKASQITKYAEKLVKILLEDQENSGKNKGNYENINNNDMIQIIDNSTQKKVKNNRRKMVNQHQQNSGSTFNKDK